MAASAQQVFTSSACRQAFAAPHLARRVACSGRSASSSGAAEAVPSGGGSGSGRRRGVLGMLAGGAAAAGLLGTRSVAAAAAVDQAEQVGSCCQHAHAHAAPINSPAGASPAWLS